MKKLAAVVDRCASDPSALLCEAVVAQDEERGSALLPLMHLFQSREGFVSPEAMRFAAEFLGLTPAVVESTVSFYPLFYRKPVGKYVLKSAADFRVRSTAPRT